MKNTKSILLILFIAIISFYSCKDDDSNDQKSYQPGSVTLEFENVVGSTHVDISGSTKYKNAVGDSFNVTKLKYYISNVELLKSDGNYYKVPESYRLIAESIISAHLAILTNIPGGVYSGMRYMVGVDSARNVSGSQTGALDPANGMYWSANSGYIFFNIEGTSPSAVSVSNTAGNFIYQIGGYQQATGINMKTITYAFGQNFIVDGTREAEVHSTVDLLELFKNPVNISLAIDNNVVMPGAIATKIANNYADMFKFEHIHNAQ